MLMGATGSIRGDLRLGSGLSIRAANRLGSSLSVQGAASFGSSISVLAPIVAGSVVSCSSFVRLGSGLSIAARSRLTDGELSVSPTEVAFTPHDGNVAKVTVVSAVDDSLAEEFERVSIFHSADSATARFFSKLDEKQRVSVAWAGITGVDAEFS